MKEERLYILEAWRDMEAIASDASDSSDRRLRDVEAMFPKKVKMRRKVLDDETGTEVGFEDYFDYQFPDDEKKIANLKLLENAMKWKLMQQAKEESMAVETGGGGGGGGGGININACRAAEPNKEELNIDDI